jgi:AraC family transcriptional regulator, transcriptional activator FtrA
MPTIMRFVPQQQHRVVAYAPGPTSPLDLGAVSEVFGVGLELGEDWYDFAVCAERRGPLTIRGGLRIVVDGGLALLGVADTIVVLPVAGFVHERPPNRVLEPLVAASARGCRIMSVCLGAFVLAAAGLLDDRRATTHWRFCDALSATYERIEVVPDVLYIDDGDILTSGGVAAGIDLCLHVVRKDLGAEVANTLARRMVFGPHRDGGQSQFIEQPVGASSVERLGPATSWALEHLSENPSVDQLASVAAMSRRTLYREFEAMIGTTPRRWLNAQKIVRACRMLETTDQSVAEVAHEAGFADQSSLWRHFTRQVGISPANYRRRFRHQPDNDGRRAELA